MSDEWQNQGGQAPQGWPAGPSQGQQTYGAPWGTQGPSDPNQAGPEERQWAMFMHLGGFAGYIFPFAGILVPFLMWQQKRQNLFVDAHGKEAVNFQISMAIYLTVSIILIYACIGFVTTPALMLFAIVVQVLAAMKANEGGMYTYPLTIRFVK